MMWAILASIPSPPINGFNIGPLRVTFYGVLVMSGVVVAWIMTKRRFLAKGGDGLAVETIMLRLVIWGFVGARLAYVSTNLSRFEQWWEVFFIWEGGLALYGGLAGGALAIWWTCRQLDIPMSFFLDAMAPGLPIAQGIGRWGNYFNQELFGTPSTLPWAIQIDPLRRPDRYAEFETFHPTFLYESLWNFALAGFIIWAEKRFAYLEGRLIGIYFVGYGLIRFLLELMRTDTMWRFLGISRNGWVSVGVIIIGALVLTWKRRTESTPYPVPRTPI